MAWGFKSEGNRSVIRQDGVARVAINEDGSMELLTPPSAAPDANDVPTFGTSLVRGTAQNATGTAIDFTGIPSWVKRVTVMLDGVSTNGSSVTQIQVGSGGVKTSGYAATQIDTAPVGNIAISARTTGFPAFYPAAPTDTCGGQIVLSNMGGNIWTASGGTSGTGGRSTLGYGSVTLSGPLDRIRLTTVNGTDTFDAGSVNIMWE